jgi:hypothetical protein
MITTTVGASVGILLRPCYRHHTCHASCPDCMAWRRAHGDVVAAGRIVHVPTVGRLTS